MSRRIEIELTSARDDGTWTWRAAGARQPRGTVDGGILPAGAKVGDLLRVESEVELEGITITSVLPNQARERTEPERIEMLGSARRDDELVTTSLVGKRDRRDRDGGGRDRGGRDRERGDRDRGDRERGPRRDDRERGRRDDAAREG
ncbi:MAG: hypothetical protein ACRD0G_20785, partial [Acidimicrobiales bacterium]